MTQEYTAQQPKAVDTNRVVAHLNRNFRLAISRLDHKADADAIKRHQVDFSYMVDDIQRGPAYLAPKVIADANELIAKLLMQTAQHAPPRQSVK